MTLSEAHVLLVDDEPVLRMTLGLLLRRQGSTVTEAADGMEALAVLRHCNGTDQEIPRRIRRQEPRADGPVDLLVLDWHMPVMDGPALLRILAAEGRSVPTVLFAGTLGEGDEPDLSAYGVQATLMKPFPPAELLQTLEAVLVPLLRRG